MAKRKVKKVESSHQHVWDVTTEEERYYCDCESDCNCYPPSYAKAKCKCGAELDSCDMASRLNAYEVVLRRVALIEAGINKE